MAEEENKFLFKSIQKFYLCVLHPWLGNNVAIV